MSDGKVVIEIDIQDKNSKSKIKELESSFKGVDRTTQKASRSIKDMVVSLGLVKIASSAFRVLRDNIDDAITRVDTMNQFPKMMQAIGFGADDSNKAVERLLEGIQGLPTRLDEVVSTAQRLAIMTGDLDSATELTLALNNAFLTSGANAQDASRGLQQYTQMLSTGKVDMQSWRTLQETMGVALNDVAKAFGFAGASAQNDLYSALQEGTITFDEFNSKLVELSNATGGFADRALIASEGIRTSFANIKTAVVNGLATMIQTVDQAMQDGGFGSIAENLDRVKVAVQDAFGVINELLPPLIKRLLDFISTLDDFIEKWDWLIIGIMAGITAFTLLNTIIPIIVGVYNAIKLWGGLILMIRSVSDGIALLTMAFPLLGNPIFLISAAIGALVAIGILLYRNWETISEWARNLASAIGTGLANAVEKISGFFEGLGFNMDWLTSGFERLSTWVSNLWNNLSNASPLEYVSGLFSNFSISTDGLRSGIEKLTGRLGELWESFKQSKVFEYIGVALGMAVDKVLGFKDAIVALVRDFDISPMLEQVAMFIPKLIGIFINKKLGLILAGANLIQSIAEGMGLTVPELFEKVTDIIVGFIEKFAEALPAVIETGVEMLTGLIDGFTKALPMVIEVIVGIVTTITETLIASLTMFIEMGVSMITAVVEGLVTALPVILETIVTILMAVVQVILGILPVLLGIGMEMLMAIVFGVLEILPVLIETFINLFILVVDTIIQLLPQFLEIGIQLLSSLLEGLMSMLPVLLEAWISLVMSVLDTIISLLPVIIDAGIQLLMALIQGIITMLPALIEAGLSLIMSLVDAFIGLLPVIIDAGIQILMALIGGLIEVLPALIESGIKILMALVEAFIGLLPVLLDAGIQILKALISGIIQMVPQLLSLGLKLIMQLGSAILSLLPVLLNAGVQLLTSLISGILSMLGSLISAGVSLITQLVSAVLGFGSRMLSAGSNLISRMVSGITSRASSAVSAIGSVIQKVWDKIAEWGSKFKDAGSNIVSSIADGITGAVGKVTSAIGNVVSKVRDFLPFSPAKTGPLMDLDRLDFAGPMSDSIDKAKRPLSRAMNDLMESASVVMDDMINLPNGNGIIQRAVASGNAGSISSSHVTNDNGVNIYVEKIENNTEGDIEKQLEEAVWIFDRNKGRL